jgi:hypothetical protein
MLDTRFPILDARYWILYARFSMLDTRCTSDERCFLRQERSGSLPPVPCLMLAGTGECMRKCEAIV